MFSEKKSYGFRGWFYFRQGWANYFAFIFAAINTLTVTYYLAIEKYPFLSQIFPNFVQYVIIVMLIGVPMLVAVGYVHWKKTAAHKEEVDIFYETNPYIVRVIVNTEILLQLSLKLNEKIFKNVKDNLTEEEIKELETLQRELLEFVKQRQFRGPMDWKFFKKLDGIWDE